MSSYWDLSQKERASLTSEQVQYFLDVELMEKGVLKAVPPEFVPVEEIPEPDVTVYGIQCGWHSSRQVYVDVESAQQAAEGALALESDYIGNESIYRIGQRQEVTIEPRKVYSPELWQSSKLAIEKNKAAKKENEDRQKIYAEAVKKQDDILSGVWDDWHESRNLESSHARLIATWEKYVENCKGQEDIAATFLQKVYPNPAIEAAFEWFGKSSPLVKAEPVGAA